MVMYHLGKQAMSNSESKPEDDGQAEQKCHFDKVAFGLRYSDTTGCLFPFLIAMLIVILFSASPGTLQTTISSSFSVVISQLNKLNEQPPAKTK
jgi:hypothetical protein